MHVLLLNQTFHPDVAATAQHLWDLARHLAASGHRVTVITARTFYGTDRQHDVARETLEGIDIHRVRGTAFGKRSVLHRLADFGSFYAAAALRMRQIDAPDVVVALTSPPMISLLGALAKSTRKAPGGAPVRFVYYMMDVYPDAQVASGMLRRGSATERSLRAVTGRTLRAADAIIVLGRDMRQLLLDRYPRDVSDDRIHIIRPWADMHELSFEHRTANPLAASANLDEQFTIVHSGNFGIAHDVDTIVGAIERTAPDGNLRWLFIGGGKRVKELQEHAAERQWQHVRFLPYQDRAALNSSLNLGDAHLVTQLPEFTGIVVPSKLFGILAIGRPVLMVGPPHSECAMIVAENEAGYVVPNGDADQLAARVRQLRDDLATRAVLGKAARVALEARYDRSIACQTIERLITGLVTEPPEGRRAGKTPAGTAGAAPAGYGP